MLPNFRSGNIEFYIKVRIGTSSDENWLVSTNGGKSLFYEVRRRKIDGNQSCANFKTASSWLQWLWYGMAFQQNADFCNFVFGPVRRVHIHWPSFWWETSIICKTATKHFLLTNINLLGIQILCSGNRIVNKSLWWTDFIEQIAFTQENLIQVIKIGFCYKPILSDTLITFL